MVLGDAAMLLWFDVLPETIAEHDEWHTREHFPERVAIPGFRRASRWIARDGSPRYMVMYEVADVGVLSSQPYLDRLNAPTPWTRKMMPSYRGMTRSFFAVKHRAGESLGTHALSVRFEPRSGHDDELRRWVTDELVPMCLDRSGVTGALFLESTEPPEMTAEQSIRGRDATARWVLLVTAYDAFLADAVLDEVIAPATLKAQGAADAIVSGRYGLACLGTAASSVNPA